MSQNQYNFISFKGKKEQLQKTDEEASVNLNLVSQKLDDLKNLITDRAEQQNEFEKFQPVATSSRKRKVADWLMNDMNDDALDWSDSDTEAIECLTKKVRSFITETVDG